MWQLTCIITIVVFCILYFVFCILYFVFCIWYTKYKSDIVFCIRSRKFSFCTSFFIFAWFLNFVFCFLLSKFKIKTESNFKSRKFFCKGKIQKQTTWYVFRLFPTNHPYKFHRIYSVFSLDLFKVLVFCFQRIKNYFVFTLC